MGRARGEKYNGHPVSRCYAGSGLDFAVAQICPIHSICQSPSPAETMQHPRLLHGRLGSVAATDLPDEVREIREVRRRGDQEF